HVIGGIAAKNGPGLQTNNRFASAPVPSSVERVTGDRKNVSAITGNAAMSPNSTTNRRWRPGGHSGWIINCHADDPAVISAAIAVVGGIRHINYAIDQPKCSALVLDQRSKSHPVIRRSGIHIYRPAGRGRTGIYVQRINEMLLGRAIDHRIEEKSSGSKTDNRCASDAKRANVATWQT